MSNKVSIASSMNSKSGVQRPTSKSTSNVRRKSTRSRRGSTALIAEQISTAGSNTIAHTLCSVFCGGSFLGCLKHHKGEVHGEIFPRNKHELKSYGIAWLNKVLHRSKHITDDVQVTKFDMVNNPGGLLGEMGLLDVSYSNGKHEKFVAKFRPSDYHTRILTTLFLFAETEHDFYRHIQPYLNKDIRVPKMVFGDIHRNSAEF